MWTKNPIYVFLVPLLYFTSLSTGDVSSNEVDSLSTEDISLNQGDSLNIEEIARSGNESVLPPSIGRQGQGGSYVNKECAHGMFKPVDCSELLLLGYHMSGVYKIWPRNRFLKNQPIEVYCNMHSQGGGWTVIQRRGDFLRPVDYFYRNWQSYKEGFGDVQEDFWLGNEKIFALTNQNEYSALFELYDTKWDYKYAKYDTFYILPEPHQYELTIEDYSGTANDSMTEFHNGAKFSTMDRDNDGRDRMNCAISYKGAWWYNNGHQANLNGLYLNGEHKSFADGVNWAGWKGFHESLRRTEIMVRPKYFRSPFYYR